MVIFKPTQEPATGVATLQGIFIMELQGRQQWGTNSNAKVAVYVQEGNTNIVGKGLAIYNDFLRMELH
jgi:hypothetical protein